MEIHFSNSSKQCFEIEFDMNHVLLIHNFFSLDVSQDKKWSFIKKRKRGKNTKRLLYLKGITSSSSFPDDTFLDASQT